MEVLNYVVNDSLRKIHRWMSRHKLQTAEYKTEVVILKSPKKRPSVDFNLKETQILPSKTVRYLGIVLDNLLIFGKHIKAVTKKAEISTTILFLILPNIGGPSNR